MIRRSLKGIARQGLDANFAADETLKSNLILKGRLFREQQQPAERATPVAFPTISPSHKIVEEAVTFLASGAAPSPTSQEKVASNGQHRRSYAAPFPFC